VLLGDFYIVDVKYGTEDELVKELKICEPFRFRPGASFWVSRDQVISLIEDGYFVELLPPDDPLIFRRWIIKLVEVDGKKYLRSDGSPVAADWLNCSPPKKEMSPVQ